MKIYDLYDLCNHPESIVLIIVHNGIIKWSGNINDLPVKYGIKDATCIEFWDCHDPIRMEVHY